MQISRPVKVLCYDARGQWYFYSPPKSQSTINLGVSDKYRYNFSMDDIKNTPGWGMPDDFINSLNNAMGKQRTSLEEMRDVLDDLADDMSQAVPENTWTDLLIYLIEALERKVVDREEFDSLLYGLLEYVSKRIE